MLVTLGIERVNDNRRRFPRGINNKNIELFNGWF